MSVLPNNTFLSNNTLINGTYDLTRLLTDDAVEDPVKWFAVFNSMVGGIVTVSILALIGFVLFLRVREVEGFSDARAAAYAGFICSMIGLVLFIARVADDPTNVFKLLTWVQLLPFLIITAVSFLAEKISRNF